MSHDSISDDPLATMIAATMQASLAAMQQPAAQPAPPPPVTLDGLLERYRPIVSSVLAKGVPASMLPLIEHLLVRDGRTPFVVLIGPTGAGKTTLALTLPLAMALHLGERRFERPMFVHADDVCAARRFAKLGDEPELLSKARTKRLVILDDVIGQKDEAGDLYRVIRHREENALSTIITAGFGRADAATSYGEQFARRMFAGISHIVGKK
jgi:predicted AAA+ superfamily ATPase